jgi:shikimate dehydrogenase
MQYGLLGGKLGHSLSPKIHELFFSYTGKKGSYKLLETPEAELPHRLQQLRSDGFTGCNVTIPHKVAVMPLLDGIAKEAAAIGAVNTIHFTEQGATIQITSVLAGCWSITALTLPGKLP